MPTSGSILSFNAPLDSSRRGDKRKKLQRRLISGIFDRSEQNSEPSWAVVPVSSVAQLTERSTRFGPFRLCPRQRLLLDGDKPLHIGSRALDILMVLLERAGELVTKQELFTRVWPGVIVAEANLKVHVASLRRTLLDGQLGNRYICTVPGRGYCFVAPVVRSDRPEPNTAIDHPQALPVSKTPMVSTGDLMAMLAAQLTQERFIMVVGVGDTLKGIFLAAALIADYQHGVRFVDLESIDDPLLVPRAVAAKIGIEISSGDPLAEITAFLEDKHLLLVLDNCKHVIGSTAALAINVRDCARAVKVLAISR